MKTKTHIVIPALLYQLQINRLPLKLPSQSRRLTPRIARHVRGLLHIGQGDQLQIRVYPKHRLEALKRRVDGAPERRRGHQLNLGVVGEVLAQLAALFMAEVCEERVWDDVVGGGEVVNALVETRSEWEFFFLRQKI